MATGWWFDMRAMGRQLNQQRVGVSDAMGMDDDRAHKTVFRMRQLHRVFFEQPHQQASRRVEACAAQAVLMGGKGGQRGC